MDKQGIVNYCLQLEKENQRLVEAGMMLRSLVGKTPGFETKTKARATWDAIVAARRKRLEES